MVIIIKYYMYLLTKNEVIIIMYGICVKIFIRKQYNVYLKELHKDQE